MKVLDIIKPVCAYLGLYQDYLTYLEPNTSTEVLPNQISIDETMPDEKRELLSLLILSTNNTQEKILKNINLVTSENVFVEENKFNLKSLSKKVNKIKNVFYKGKKLKFKKFDDFVRVYNVEDYDKNLEIEYSYFLPYIETLQDDLPLETLVKLKTLALGITSEYCYISGLFDDAEIWNKKFLQELEEDKKKVKNFVTPKRSWR